MEKERKGEVSIERHTGDTQTRFLRQNLTLSKHKVKPLHLSPPLKITFKDRHKNLSGSFEDRPLRELFLVLSGSTGRLKSVSSH